MPRSTIADRRAYLFDKELELRSIEVGAVAATASESPIQFPATKQMAYKAVVDIAAHTGYVAGTAQWEVSVEVATTSSGTYSKVGSCIPNGEQNRFDIPLSGEWVQDILAGAAYVRVTATKTGSPGDLNYGAYLTKC
ncbi:MAG: hypothetical protein QNJ36_19800 [Calothrix sp. MO_167.B42]|nr:hypothetical protein [Calothrix sp. MO_167.B42]